MAKMSTTAAPIEGSGAGKSTPATISADANLSESDIEVWNDVEWQPALYALEGWQPDGSYTGKPDPRPLAKLLRSGKPVPEAVAVRLGVFLDPPWGKKGPKLTLSISQRYSGYADLQQTKAMMATKREIEEVLPHFGKLEAAITEIAQRTDRSRSYLMKAWKLDFREIVLRTSKFNPQPFSTSPHEPERS